MSLLADVTRCLRRLTVAIEWLGPVWRAKLDVERDINKRNWNRIQLMRIYQKIFFGCLRRAWHRYTVVGSRWFRFMSCMQECRLQVLN